MTTLEETHGRVKAAMQSTIAKLMRHRNAISMRIMEIEGFLKIMNEGHAEAFRQKVLARKENRPKARVKRSWASLAWTPARRRAQAERMRAKSAASKAASAAAEQPAGAPVHG